MSVEVEQVVAALPGLLRYAMALTRDPDAAEDLVQETVVRALERSDQYAGKSSLATWLHRVMYHRFIDELRRLRVDPVDDEILATAVESAWRDDSYTVDAEALLLRVESREELLDALVRLPVHYRTAVMLHDVEGLTGAELAEIQQVSLSAAKQRIRRGRHMLVTALAGGVERRVATQGVPMNCWQARSQIDDYLSDTLDHHERGLLEQHLATCPTCPALFASIVGVTEALGALRDPNSVVAPGLAARVREVAASRAVR